MEKKDLEAMRHSLAHIMAGAIQTIWPDVKLGTGPVVDNGFYYDVDLGDTSISESDLSKIEDEMNKVIKSNTEFKQSTMTRAEAEKWAKENNQPYKLELIKEQDGDISFYAHGDFMDLCEGPHISKTGDIGAFKLTKLAGAYWRANEDNPQMQRIYGVAFASQKDLDEFLKNQELAEERDHRRIGKDLDLFFFSDYVGPGLPIFTPRGAMLRNKLNSYSHQLRKAMGYMEVSIPYLAKEDLYKTSGHWDKFADELFLVKSQQATSDFVLKPMNCPHHVQVYASQPRSYKDLPFKLTETTGMYRDEKTGELHGLSRVRSATIDDGHAFVREDQIEQAVTETIKAVKTMYKQLDMQVRFELSFRDEGKQYLGDKKLWEKSQTILKDLAEKNKLDFKIEEGEAAFYGPKIDFIAVDSLGRSWQVATVQLDFVMPERFELEYVDEDNTAKRPVMIHSALLGSIERFLSVYIEHTAGHFPFWLAPEQLRVVTVNDQVGDYVSKVEEVLGSVVLDEPLKYNELRYSIDDSNQSLGKKIADAEKMKIPVILIVGPKDEQAKQVSVRVSGKEDKVDLDKLQDWLNKQ